MNIGTIGWRSKCIGLVLAVFALALHAQATLISYESFSGYTVGNELQSAGGPTPAGYSGSWTDIDFGNAEPVVLSGSLSYSGSGYPGTSGDSVGVPSDTTPGPIDVSNSGRIYRLFDTSLTVTDSTIGTRYLSFLFQSGQETGPTSYQMLSLYNSNTADANRNFDAGLTDNGVLDGTQFGFGVDDSYSSLGVAADTDVHLFVARFTLSASAGADSVTVWLDPTAETGGTSVSGLTLTWDRVALSDYDGNSASFDEVRWGDSFSDVAVVPEPSAVTLLGSALAGLALIRRKRAA